MRIFRLDNGDILKFYNGGYLWINASGYADPFRKDFGGMLKAVLRDVASGNAVELFVFREYSKQL